MMNPPPNLFSRQAQAEWKVYTVSSFWEAIQFVEIAADAVSIFKDSQA